MFLCSNINCLDFPLTIRVHAFFSKRKAEVRVYKELGEIGNKSADRKPGESGDTVGAKHIVQYQHLNNKYINGLGRV